MYEKKKTYSAPLFSITNIGTEDMIAASVIEKFPILIGPSGYTFQSWSEDDDQYLNGN